MAGMAYQKTWVLIFDSEMSARGSIVIQGYLSEAEAIAAGESLLASEPVLDDGGWADRLRPYMKYRVVPGPHQPLPA